MVRFVNSVDRTLPWLLAAAVLAFCATFTVAEAKDKGPSKPKNHLAKVEGKITAVDATAGTVTVTRRKGTSVTVNVTADTKIEVDEAHATLADLAVGMFGEAKYDATTLNAAKIEGETPAAP